MPFLKTVSLETERKVGSVAGEVGTLFSLGAHLFLKPSSSLIPPSSPRGLLPASRLLTKIALSLKFLAMYVVLRS